MCSTYNICLIPTHLQVLDQQWQKDFWESRDQEISSKNVEIQRMDLEIEQLRSQFARTQAQDHISGMEKEKEKTIWPTNNTKPLAVLSFANDLIIANKNEEIQLLQKKLLRIEEVGPRRHPWSVTTFLSKDHPILAYFDKYSIICIVPLWCIYTYICIYAYSYICVYIYICIYICMYTYICMHMFIYIHISYVYTCIYSHVHYVYIYTYVYTYMYIYIYIYIYTYICMYTHTHIYIYSYTLIYIIICIGPKNAKGRRKLAENVCHQKSRNRRTWAASLSL